MTLLSHYKHPCLSAFIRGQGFYVLCVFAVIHDLQKTGTLPVEILTGLRVYESPGPLIVYPSPTATTDSMTSTSAAILVLLNRTASSTSVIPFTFEITRMTAGTEWRVS